MLVRNYLPATITRDGLLDSTDKAQLPLTPEAYGAIGDGVTDDTVAVQATVDAALAAGGPRAVCFVGEYLVDPIIITNVGTAGLAEDGEEGKLTLFGLPGAVLKLKSGVAATKRAILKIHDCCLGRMKIHDLRFEGNVDADGETIPKEMAINIYNSKGGGDRGHNFTIRDCHFRNLWRVMMVRNPDEGSASVLNDILWNSVIENCTAACIREHDFLFTWPFFVAIRNWNAENVFAAEPSGEYTDNGKTFSVVSLNAGHVLMENFAVSGKGHGYAANTTKMIVYGSNVENAGPQGFRFLSSFGRLAYCMFFPPRPGGSTNAWGGVNAIACYADSASQVLLEGNIYRSDSDVDWLNNCALHSDGNQNIFMDLDGRGTPQASFDAFAGSRVYFKTGDIRRPVNNFQDLGFHTTGDIVLGHFHEVWGVRLKRTGTHAMQVRNAADDSYGDVHLQYPVLQGAAPASAGAAGTQGMFAYDSGFLYIATGTNTWKRVAVATW